MTAADCPVTELPTSMCACDRCRPDLAEAEAVGAPESATIRAQYSSVCPVCDGRIRMGDSISRVQGEQYWSHTECLG